MKTTREIYEGYIKDKDMWSNYKRKWYSEEEIRKIIDSLEYFLLFKINNCQDFDCCQELIEEINNYLQKMKKELLKEEKNE
jgi:hypothetical protein